MGFSERIRGFFSKRSSPALEQLVGFVSERKGIEGFVEPRTNTNPVTLLLVDRDGAHARAPVHDARAAHVFCEQHAIPVYDAQVIGYPKRMKDYERRRRQVNLDTLDAEIEALEKRLENPE